MGKKIKKFEIYGFVICSVGLILVQFYYAGIVSNLWYVINLLFWGITGIFHIRFGKFKNGSKWISGLLLVGLFIVGAFILKLPNYDPKDAKKVILEEHSELVDVIAKDARQYKGFMDHYMYLIVFETEPLTAFWFDAYSGDYGEYDIEDRLPFVK